MNAYFGIDRSNAGIEFINSLLKKEEDFRNSLFSISIQLDRADRQVPRPAKTV
jgi:hypothetical protein